MRHRLFKKNVIICVMTFQKSIETCFKKYFVFDGISNPMNCPYITILKAMFRSYNGVINNIIYYVI